MMFKVYWAWTLWFVAILGAVNGQRRLIRRQEGNFAPGEAGNTPADQPPNVNPPSAASLGSESPLNNAQTIEVLPSPGLPADTIDSQALTQAKAFLAQANLDQKAAIVTGTGWASSSIGYSRCVGGTVPVPELGFDGLCLQDAPLGVRFTDGASAFPAGIHVAATFNRDFIYRRGVAIGEEFRGKGINVHLGPMMNMMRAPAGGRIFEGFGGDPYLAGEAAYLTIKGVQEQGVQACAKHLVGNEQEHYRTTESSNIDDRTMHELYLAPFAKSITLANVSSLMCSYNLVNNSWACQNSKLLNGLVKQELDFKGYILSDWQATMSGVSAIEAGLDMTMPGDVQFGSNNSYFGANLTMAVQNGSVPEARLDDMVLRVMSQYYLNTQNTTGLANAVGYPKVNLNSFNFSDPTNEHVNVQSDHYKLIRQLGSAGTVLLKNERNALPLKAPRSIAVIGSDAGPTYAGANQFADRGGDAGTLAMGWGSGSVNFPYLISPLAAIQERARLNATSVQWNLNDYDYAAINRTVSKDIYAPDVVLVFVNADSGEGYITVGDNFGDRNNLTAWHDGDTLINMVAANNNNTIVIVHSPGPVLVEAWIDHPNVTAVLFAHMPGQESGPSLVDVLYGDWNPSGRLPYTLGKDRRDYPADVVYTSTDTTPQINYDEGLLIDYRWFDAKAIQPRFPFGFGLSYSSYEYSNMYIDGPYLGPQEVWYGPSGEQGLHDTIYEIGVNVTNTGLYYGGDVPQVYLSKPQIPGEPLKTLVSFEMVNLSPGASKIVVLPITKKDVSRWDVVAQRWLPVNGTMTVTVSRDAGHPVLNGTLPSLRVA